MTRKTCIFLAFFITFSTLLFAQDKIEMKFGKVSERDFTVSSPIVDSGTGAIVLGDIGTCAFEGNSQGWFTMVFKRHKRVRIINNNGMDVANVSIYLYTDGKDPEKITELKAASYNLENGKITSVKLDSKSVFDDKLDKNWIEEKFALPAVKNGTVIEYTYTIRSAFLFHLQPWAFQGEYPCLWSEYTVKLPALFNYVVLKQGSTKYYIFNQEEKTTNYRVEIPGRLPYGGANDVVNVACNVTDTRWVMKDVPALIPQNFTSTIDNYISKLEFQLSEIRMPDQPVEEKLKDWNQATAELLKFDEFGRAISDDANWLDEPVKSITTAGAEPMKKIRQIFEYVRDNFACTGNTGIFFKDGTTLEQTWRKKSGSVSNINLLLVAMLRRAGISADPVILSTRSHGFVEPNYPMMEKFNYVICRVKLDYDPYYLDATNPFLGFGHLDPECYNGLARVISTPAEGIYLKADGLHEVKRTQVTIAGGSDSQVGHYTSLLGYNESLQLREKLSKEKEEGFFKELETSDASEIQIRNEQLDSLQNRDKAVTLSFDFSLENSDADVRYFHPMIREGFKENPFPSEQRIYPVEMPYCSDNIYTLDMRIPKGYEVEALPEPLKLQLSNGYMLFAYQALRSDTSIHIQCQLQVNRTVYDPSDYANLRNFFSEIVKKENEPVVFRKIK